MATFIHPTLSRNGQFPSPVWIMKKQAEPAKAEYAPAAQKEIYWL